MPERQRVPLPMGPGLDRSSAKIDRPPGAVLDIRNLLLKEQKAQARGGITEQVGVTMDGGGTADDIVFVAAHRAAVRNVLVAHRSASTEPLQVFRTATNGLNPIFADGWPAPPATRPEPPVVHGAEVYTRFFLAHDEEDIGYRRPTQILTSAGVLSTLQADLDGAGNNDVYFRGVFRYLSYLGGWGFGTDADPDRGEIVRLSLPDDATVFRKEHLFYCGARGEPVIACAPTSNRILVLKERETHVITGYDRSTFGVRQIDPSYGVVSPRAWAVLEGVVYVWSVEGPRAYYGDGASEDLALPLDLDGPEPADLIASGEASLGWAEYLQREKVLLFGFPNRDEGVTRGYALSLRDPQRPRWSYLEFGRALWCAGRVYAPVGGVGAPVGLPDNVALAFTGLTGTVTWDNVSAIGDETVEVWLKVGAGIYRLVREVTVDGSSQSLDLTEDDGTVASTAHTVALRYRRGSAYAATYQNPVTSGWTGTAVTDSTASDTTDATPSSPATFVWTDCTEVSVGGKTYIRVSVSWTNGTSDPGAVTEILESVGGGAAAVIATHALAVTDDEVGDYLVTPSASERDLFVRHNISGLVSAQVALDVNPIAPANGCTA